MKMLYAYLLIAIIVAPYLLSALVSSIVYWHYRRTKPCPALSAPPHKLHNIMGMFAHIFADHFRAILFHPVGWSMRARYYKSKNNKTPLLLLHGIYKNSSSWYKMQHILQKQDFSSVSISYHSFFTDLPSIMDKLEQKVQELEKKHPGKKPVLIGHSLGGVLIRNWLLQNNNEKRLTAVITLGTPHTGSILAKIAPGALIKNIVPNSKLMQKFEQEEKTPTIPCTAICSPTDELVLPAESLLPPKGWKLRVINPCTHFGLMLAKHSADALIEELKQLLKDE